MELREVETPGSAGLPQCLDLHYEEDFLEKRSHQVPAVFSDPLFIPSMANAVYKAFKPPVLPKASPSAGGCKVPSVSSQPEDSGPKPEKFELEKFEARSPTQAPQRPVNGSRSKSPRLLILTQTRPMSLLQKRNRLLKVSKSKSPIDSGSTAARP